MSATKHSKAGKVRNSTGTHVAPKDRPLPGALRKFGPMDRRAELAIRPHPQPAQGHQVVLALNNFPSEEAAKDFALALIEIVAKESGVDKLGLMAK